MHDSPPIDEKCSSTIRVAVKSGQYFRVSSPAENAIVTTRLAAELENVLERFALETGNRGVNKVGIFFKPGIFGHHRVGRAVDIYAVGGIGIDSWKKRWDRAQLCACKVSDAQKRSALLVNEQNQNLGWRLYKALKNYGRWSHPCGYPIQLFGPWTRSEGPWNFISDFLLRAHRDHIHVAK